MDIATEEFSHLEIVGATIQMLLTGINGDLKDASENSEIMQLLNGKAAKETFIHQAMVAPQCRQAIFQACLCQPEFGWKILPLPLTLRV